MTGFEPAASTTPKMTAIFTSVIVGKATRFILNRAISSAFCWILHGFFAFSDENLQEKMENRCALDVL